MLSAPTADQIRTLAPHGAAARAGEQLATGRRWSDLGRADDAAWGLCQGSGATPYQVAVDLAGTRFACTCPSRKVPCKHALGLLFIVAAGDVTPAQPPDWAASTLAGIRERQTSRRRTAAPREVDADAQARRIDARERKVLHGIDELGRWLSDLLRRGLDSTRTEGYRFWDSMAARLVDAQASVLARSVRGLGAVANAADQWPQLLLEGVARLHLLIEAYLHLDELPQDLRADVRSLVGWNVREDDLDQAAAVTDRWLVVGRRVDDTGGQVITARTWFVGEASGRVALHLAFGVDAAPPTVIALPGQAIRATLAFYPSATPLRAAVRPVVDTAGEVTAVPGGRTFDGVLRDYADRLARNPFVDAWPVVLADVVAIARPTGALVRDAAGAALPVGPAAAIPRLLAASGGRPVTLVGEWDGARLRPMSILVEDRLVDVGVGGDGFRPALPAGSTDDAWSRLVSAALLGTERSGDVPLPADDVGQVVARVPALDPERRILATAALLAVRRRAGRRPMRDVLPPPEPAAVDPRPAVSPRLARLLPAVLFDDPAILAEFLDLTRAAGRRLPDERLPDLFAIAARAPALRAPISQLAGPRGTWLAATLPEIGASMPWLMAAPPDSAPAAPDAAPAGSGAPEAAPAESVEAAATAILAVATASSTGRGRDVGALLDPLSPATRAAVVASLARRIEPALFVRLVRRCPVPWPDSLALAVVDVIASVSDQPFPAAWFGDLVRAAALAVPPAVAGDLSAAAEHRGEPRSALVGALDTLALRREMHAAFAELEDPHRRS